MKFYSSKILLLIACALLGTACSNQAVYTGESFASDSPFKMRLDGDVALACKSARRALLGQGYLIENADGEEVKARKALRRDDHPNTFIEINVVCLPETTGSTLFATGLLSTYSLKKSTSSASVGVSALGSISLPIGQSADSLVKVSEETIDDKEFYGRFFAAVGDILAEMQADSPDLEPVVIAVEPGPELEPTTLPEPEPVVTDDTVAPMQAQEAPASAPGPSLHNEDESELTIESILNENTTPTLPEPTPVQTSPAITPEPAPIQTNPAITPESAPVQATPAMTLESILSHDSPAVMPAESPTTQDPAPPAELAPISTHETPTADPGPLSPPAVNGLDWHYDE